MKTILKSLFLVFAVSFTSITSFAQPKTPIVNKPEHMEEFDCDDVIPIFIELTNLDQYSPPQSGNSDFLPDGYPEMYIAITIDGTTEYIELYSFYYSHFDAVSVWRVDIDFPINQCDDCNGGQAFPVFIDLELVTPGSGGFVPYPICDYTSPNDIFSCEYFTHLPCNPSSNSECEDIGAGTNSGPLLINCPNPTPNPNPWGGWLMQENDDNDSSWDIAVAPNPFYGDIKVSSTKDINSITLYDIHGRTVLQSAYANDADYNIKLNTDEILPGIYLLAVEAEGETEIMKLVK